MSIYIYYKNSFSIFNSIFFFNWLMLEIFIIQYLFIPPLNMQDILTLMIRTILYQNILY